jgi:hypothetical protein
MAEMGGGRSGSALKRDYGYDGRNFSVVDTYRHDYSHVILATTSTS